MGRSPLTLDSTLEDWQEMFQSPLPEKVSALPQGHPGPRAVRVQCCLYYLVLGDHRSCDSKDNISGSSLGHLRHCYRGHSNHDHLQLLRCSPLGFLPLLLFPPRGDVEPDGCLL